jgi:hypothetical protein
VLRPVRAPAAGTVAARAEHGTVRWILRLAPCGTRSRRASATPRRPGPVPGARPSEPRVASCCYQAPPQVIILTTFDLHEYVHAAPAAGVGGFLLKGVTPGQLVAAVRLVRTGDALPPLGHPPDGRTVRRGTGHGRRG